MRDRNKSGDAATPPVTERVSTSGMICRYHGPTDPHKIARFIVDRHTVITKGKVAAFLRALISAGSEGVAHVEVMPWLINASDAAKSLRDRGVWIDTQKGNPSRWVLRAYIREVLP